MVSLSPRNANQSGATEQFVDIDLSRARSATIAAAPDSVIAAAEPARAAPAPMVPTPSKLDASFRVADRVAIDVLGAPAEKSAAPTLPGRVSMERFVLTRIVVAVAALIVLIFLIKITAALLYVKSAATAPVLATSAASTSSGTAATAVGGSATVKASAATTAPYVFRVGVLRH